MRSHKGHCQRGKDAYRDVIARETVPLNTDGGQTAVLSLRNPRDDDRFIPAVYILVIHINRRQGGSR